MDCQYVNLIAYLEFTSMNYPGFRFSRHLIISRRGMVIVKFVPLVPLMVQVAENFIIYTGPVYHNII